MPRTKQMPDARIIRNLDVVFNNVTNEHEILYREKGRFIVLNTLSGDSPEQVIRDWICENYDRAWKPEYIETLMERKYDL